MQRRHTSHPGAGTRRRRQTLVVLSLMAALLVPAAIAWACGPNRQMQCDRMTYAPGGTVSCSGVNFYENMDLTFRLDNGPQVGSVKTSPEGTFTFSFAAPGEPGAYTLVAEGFDEQGNYRPGLPARQSFEVAAPAPAQQQETGGGGSPQSPGAAPSPGARNPAPGSDSPTRQGRDGPSRSGDQGRARTESPAERNGGGQAERNGGGQGSPRSGNGVSVPAGGGPVNTNEGVVDSGGQDVFTGSVTREERASTVDGGPAASSESGGAAPSEASAAGDLWSGFGSGANPSLLPGGNDALSPEAETSPGVTWGLGLLGLGLLALMATLAVAEARRRRAGTR